jgi:hypothetical protein
MTQLTVALTSKDVSRLTKTWAYVPQADMQTLKQLEDLVTPTHNFHNLRAEMEGSGADQGCIPFVGIYTHDQVKLRVRQQQSHWSTSSDAVLMLQSSRISSGYSRQASCTDSYPSKELPKDACGWQHCLTRRLRDMER